MNADFVIVAVAVTEFTITIVFQEKFLVMKWCFLLDERKTCQVTLVFFIV